jgi:hypothetical protein
MAPISKREEGAVSVVMQMHWREISPDEYERVREMAGWERDVPDGVKLHISAFGDDGLHVLDVWESADHFQSFMQSHVMPAVQEVGIAGEPEVQFFPLQGVFAPALGHFQQTQDV